MDSKVINHLTLINDSGADSHDIDMLVSVASVISFGYESYVVSEVLNDGSNVYYTICDLI